MKTIARKSIAGVAAVMSAAICTAALSVSASADLTKEEVIEQLWEVRSSCYNDDGTWFPESSWCYNVLADWVEENYDDIGSSTSLYSWDYQYNQYYKGFIRNIDIDEDEQGNWTVTDESTGIVYSFEFVDGMWNQLNPEGSVVDTFPPVNTLEEESSETTEPVYTQARITDSYSSADGNNASHTEAAINSRHTTTRYNSSRYTTDHNGDSAAVVIKNSSTAVRATETEMVSDNGEETVPEKEDSTLLPIILGTVAAVGAAAVIGVYYIKKK